MNERQANRWANTRAKGRTRYILIYGVLLWGLFTGVAWSVVMSVIQKWDLRLLLPSSVVLFAVAGYFFGKYTWNLTETEYRKFLAKQGKLPEADKMTPAG